MCPLTKQRNIATLIFETDSRDNHGPLNHIFHFHLFFAIYKANFILV